MTAALSSLQTEISERDKIIALQEDAAKIQAEELAAANRRFAALEAVNKALEKAKQEAEVRAEANTTEANFTQASSKARFRIILYEANGENEVSEVPVGVNGRTYQLKRGVEIDVPKDVINVLKDAVIGRAEAVLDPVTQISSGVKFVNGHRFPFQFIRQTIDEDGNEIPEKG